jgi:hypothetical protein
MRIYWCFIDNRQFTILRWINATPPEETIKEVISLLRRIIAMGASRHCRHKLLMRNTPPPSSPLLSSM